MSGATSGRRGPKPASFHPHKGELPDLRIPAGFTGVRVTHTDDGLTIAEFRAPALGTEPAKWVYTHDVPEYRKRIESANLREKIIASQVDVSAKADAAFVAADHSFEEWKKQLGDELWRRIFPPKAKAAKK